MHPLLILAIGVVIVIGGVLLLRMHAYLALVVAALVVGLLTPQSALDRYWVEQDKLTAVNEEEAAAQEVKVANAAKAGLDEGMQFLVLRGASSTAPLEQVGRVAVREIRDATDEKGNKKSIAVLTSIGGADGASLTLKRGDVVIDPRAYRAGLATAGKTVGERVARDFGSTCASIGILIAMAAIIGKCLLDSGAADKIVRASMRVTGESGAPIAFLGSGFLLGIPVFFDTVFYLMIPLGKALQMRTGRNYLLFVLSIVAGATMAHSLVPPTPGPLFVAGELGVDLGMMIVAGCLVGLCSSTAGFLFARFANARGEVPLRESPDFSLKDLEELSKRTESQLPPLWLALTPIVLPVLLIAGNTVLKTFNLLPADSPLAPIAETLGNKNVALSIAAGVAMLMLVWQQRTSLVELNKAVGASLASGGVIILITAGGGAFGGALKQTGVANLISEIPTQSHLVVLILAFLITTAIRTAQGSATVAMITAVGVLAGFAEEGQLGCNPVYLALAIGCGSKPIAWMNDSGFWVICKMSGMTEAEGLRYVTPMSILMGLVGLAVTLLAAWLMPLNA
ncbi:MAG: SLC13 family permease [Pirellulaceae bacterium]